MAKGKQAERDNHVPPALAKRGLKRIIDNMPEAHQVRLPPGELFKWFGEQLMEGVVKKADQAQ